MPGHADERHEMRPLIAPTRPLEGVRRARHLALAADERCAADVTGVDAEARAASDAPARPARGRPSPWPTPDRAPHSRSPGRWRGTSARRRGSPPGGAADWRRAAVLITSPTPSPPPPPARASSETSASPVLTPTRTSSSSAGSASFSSAIASWMRERRPHRPLRVVLVRHGGAEHRHHGVADELLDRATVGLELVPHARVVRGEQRAHVFRVELLRARSRADEVGEHDRDDLALLAARDSLLVEHRAAPGAEARRRPGSPAHSASRSASRESRTSQSLPQAVHHEASVVERLDHGL